jgi:hypothetical protein
MSKYLDYKGYIFKISNKVLGTFETYSLEQQTLAHITLCKYLYDFVINYNARNKIKIKIEHNSISYYSNIIDFSKYDKKFRDKLINNVIIYINGVSHKGNSEGLFSKLCDFVEE